MFTCVHMHVQACGGGEEQGSARFSRPQIGSKEQKNQLCLNLFQRLIPANQESLRMCVECGVSYMQNKQLLAL